jgi:hypothetical protein
MKVVAFLDILGFGNISKTDVDGAIDLITNYEAIVNNKITDQNIHPDLSTTHPKVCADSFETLLPFSDSIFITSSDPNTFVEQVSHLVSQAFLINAEQYTNPENPDCIIESTILHVSVEKNKRSLVHKYPLLFRGGISYGDVYNFNVNSILNKEINQIKNLTGKALVEAVELERSGKGPRLFCNKSFIKQLDQQIINKYIGTIIPDELYEIYWTTSVFFDENDLDLCTQDFGKILIPAVNLWRAFGSQPHGNHYFEFVKLIIKGNIQYYRIRGNECLAKEYVKDICNELIIRF